RQVSAFDRDLERRKLRVVSRLLRDELIDRYTCLDFRRVRSLRRNVREESRRCARVDAGSIRSRRRQTVRESREDREAVAERFERLDRGRKRERRALLGRRPL